MVLPRYIISFTTERVNTERGEEREGDGVKRGKWGEEVEDWGGGETRLF